MKHCLIILLAILFINGIAFSQTTPTPTPSRPTTPSPQRSGAAFEIAEYGVEFQADPRLIVVMAALEAAGFDPLQAGRQPSAFRNMVQRDLAELDPQLRERLRTFYERKLSAAAGNRRRSSVALRVSCARAESASCS